MCVFMRDWWRVTKNGFFPAACGYAAIALLLAGCEFTEPLPVGQVQDGDASVLVQASGGQFGLRMTPERSLQAGVKAQETNTLVLSFFQGSSEEPARQVEVHSVTPYMPTMGHGAVHKHRLHTEGLLTHQVAVEGVYFNMPSMGAHQWVLYVDVSVDQVRSRLTVPLKVYAADARQAGDDDTPAIDPDPQDETWLPVCEADAQVYTGRLRDADNDQQGVRGLDESKSSPFGLMVDWTQAEEGRPLAAFDPVNQVVLALCRLDANSEQPGALRLLDTTLTPRMLMLPGRYEHGNCGAVGEVCSEDTDQKLTDLGEGRVLVEKVFFSMASRVRGKKLGQWYVDISVPWKDQRVVWALEVPDVLNPDIR